MQLVRAEIQAVFKELADPFQVTSRPTENYNCIAWAADDQTHWWWPDPDGESFWPPGIEREDTVDAFVAAFRTLGYEPCDSSNLETGYDKVVIYAVGNKVKHMAKQLSSGAWSSKLGEWWDISHRSIGEIAIPDYGIQAQILRRLKSEIR